MRHESPMQGDESRLGVIGSDVRELGTKVLDGCLAANSIAMEQTHAATKEAFRLGIRATGEVLSHAGIDPVAKVGRFLKAETAHTKFGILPREEVSRDKRAILWAYDRPKSEDSEAGRTPRDIPILLVPPLMGNSEIMDKTVVPATVNGDLDTYRLEFTEVERLSDEYTFEKYIETVVDAIEQIKSDRGVEEISILGWCQGAYLVTILAALQEQIAERKGLERGDLGIKNVVLLTPPLSVTEEDKKLGGFAGMSASPGFNPEAIVRANGGIYPGEAIKFGAKMLKPRANFVETHRYLWDLVKQGNEPKIKAWEQMNTWVNQAPNMGKSYLFILRELYGKNSLVNGTMEVDGMPVSLANLKASVDIIEADQDHIVTPDETNRALPLIGSDDLTVNEKHGGHIGAVSAATCKEIVGWLTEKGRSDVSEEEGSVA